MFGSSLTLLSSPHCQESFGCSVPGLIAHIGLYNFDPLDSVFSSKSRLLFHLTSDVVRGVTHFLAVESLEFILKTLTSSGVEYVSSLLFHCSLH